MQVEILTIYIKWNLGHSDWIQEQKVLCSKLMSLSNLKQITLIASGLTNKYIMK